MEQKPQLEKQTIAFMVAVAFFFDAIQALLDLVFIGWIFVPLAYITFWFWFKKYGIKFFSAKRAPTLATGAILETISAGILPATTLTVLRIALDYKVGKPASI